MEALTPLLNALTAEQRQCLRHLEDAGFNLRAFSITAKISLIEAAAFMSDPAIQSILAVFDSVSTQAFERAASSARTLVMETLRAALPNATDPIEGRRLATLLLRCVGPRPKTSKRPTSAADATPEDDSAAQPNFDPAAAHHPATPTPLAPSHSTTMPTPQPTPFTPNPAASASRSQKHR